MLNKRMLGFLKKWVLMLLSVLTLASCGSHAVMDKSGQDMINSSGVYTLVNLHPDMARSRLYAVNYQMPGIIPLCTEVTLLKASKKQMKFKVNSTGQEFSYLYHRAAGEPLASHLTHFFGRKCNAKKVKGMSAVDQKGIKKGVPLKGMSRDGVVLAMGIPPRHKTPDLNASTWKYWKNRFDTMDVVFGSNGLVSKIVD